MGCCMKIQDKRSTIAPKLSLKVGEMIGKGAFSNVYKSSDKNSQNMYAVKRCDTSSMKAFKRIVKEGELLETLNHPNIVKIYQTNVTSNYVDLVIEYASGGTLKDLVERNGVLAESKVKQYGLQILDALEYLHDKRIVHRDLKAANLLFTHTGSIKITDFGSSRKFKEKNISKSVKGSPYWMAPEVIKKTGHSYPCDIWSFGCVIIEMVTGKPPWSDISQNTRLILTLIASTVSYPSFPKVSPELSQVLNACIQKQPELRPSAKELKRFNFFR